MLSFYLTLRDTFLSSLSGDLLREIFIMRIKFSTLVFSSAVSLSRTLNVYVIYVRGKKFFFLNVKEGEKNIVQHSSRVKVSVSISHHIWHVNKLNFKYFFLSLFDSQVYTRKILTQFIRWNLHMKFNEDEEK